MLKGGSSGTGGRVLLGAGAAVSVAGVRGARLGRPLDLPAPAAGYLAGVWGRSVGEARPAALGGLEGACPGQGCGDQGGAPVWSLCMSKNLFVI